MAKLGIILTLVGAGMIEMALTDPEAGIGIKIFMTICGLIFLIPGIWLDKWAIEELKKKIDKSKEEGEGFFTSTAKNLKSAFTKLMLPGYGAEPDKNKLETALTSFRNHLSEFYSTAAPVENASIQADVTQIYRNILEYRRNRLRNKGISLRFESVRKNYGNKAVSSKNYFDGKYEISEVREDIAAKTVFVKDDKPVFTRVDKDIAFYTITKTKQIGINNVICPNCGNTTDRDNLLDGCDFCHTKFMIEDLGTRVSDFALRKDYDIEYQKYKDARRKMFYWVCFIWGSICVLFSLFFAIKSAPKIGSEENLGPIMMIMITLMSVVIAGGFLTAIGVGAFMIWVFPWIQLGASFSHVSKKILSKLEKSSENDAASEKRVRSFDNNFSIAGFFSNIQNKLAVIHYAESAAQINTFSLCDMTGFLERYKDVIDMEIKYIALDNYRVDKGLQVAEVSADVRLTGYNGKKCTARNESLKLVLTKAADCKTQVVCGPSVMTCHHCGSSISLLDGRLCTQCGNDIGLERYDWVIREYKV